MTGTHLFYGGVLLRDCETKNWVQDIIRDESGTDVLYSKVTLSVESTLVSLVETGSSVPSASGINAPLSTIAVPNTGTENIVDRLKEVQWRLQQTRQDFWLAMNGVTSVAATGIPQDSANNSYSYRVVLAATGLSTDDLSLLAASSNASLGKIDGFNDGGLGTPELSIDRDKVIDLNNGPKPISVNVQKVFGGRALRVNLTIEVCRCFCAPETLTTGTPPTPVPPVKDATKVTGVLSNRWSLTETMDEQWKTTHAIEGKLQVSDVRYKPHAMRLIVTPKLFPYAKMTSRTFATDRTGLTLAYRFELRETGPAAPVGVADWTGRYEEQSVNGGKNLATIVVKLTGYTAPTVGGLANANDPDPHKEQKYKLLQIGQRIINARVSYDRAREALPGQNPATTTITDLLVVEQMDKPTIEMRASFLYADKATLNAGGGLLVSGQFGLRLLNMGKSIASDVSDVDPNYSPKWWRSPDPFPWDIDSETTASEAFGYGTYYDCYFQTCCSEWHSTPRGAIPPDSVERDAAATQSNSYAANPPGGFGVFNAGLPSANLLFVPNLTYGNETIGDPVQWAETWWADNQASFPYYQASVDTEFPMETGKIQMGLSAPRPMYPSGATQTAVVVQLHAGICQRIVTVVATREGDWPIMPQATAVVTHGDIVEEFLYGKVIPDAPKLMPDGKAFLYSMQVRWVYSMTRLPNQPTDYLVVTKDPRDKTLPARNNILISSYFAPGVYTT